MAMQQTSETIEFTIPPSWLALVRHVAPRQRVAAAHILEHSQHRALTVDDDVAEEGGGDVAEEGGGDMAEEGGGDMAVVEEGLLLLLDDKDAATIQGYNWDRYGCLALQATLSAVVTTKCFTYPQGSMF